LKKFRIKTRKDFRFQIPFFCRIGNTQKKIYSWRVCQGVDWIAPFGGKDGKGKEGDADYGPRSDDDPV
jgi:hypothetical protein